VGMARIGGDEEIENDVEIERDSVMRFFTFGFFC
jgi:hypothetical protein